MKELLYPKHVKKNSIILYGDYLDLVEHLPLEERGRLFTALLGYAQKEDSEEKASFGNVLTELIYTVIMGQLRRDRERYLEVCEANRARAIARWQKQNEESIAPSCDSQIKENEPIAEMQEQKKDAPNRTLDADVRKSMPSDAERMPTHAEACRSVPKNAKTCPNDTDTGTYTNTGTETYPDTETKNFLLPLTPSSKAGETIGKAEERFGQTPTSAFSENGEKNAENLTERQKRRLKKQTLAAEKEAFRTFTTEDLMRVMANANQRM